MQDIGEIKLLKKYKKSWNKTEDLQNMNWMLYQGWWQINK